MDTIVTIMEVGYENAGNKNQDTLRSTVYSGKESVLHRTLQESAGPIKSFLAFTAHKISGGRILPELAQYFGPHEAGHELPSVGLGEAKKVLDTMNSHLSSDWIAENFIGPEAPRWTALKARIGEAVGSGAKVTDYVLFSDADTYVFLTNGDGLIPIRVAKDEKDLKTQLIRNKPILSINIEPTSDDLSRAVRTEVAISDFMRMGGIDNTKAVVRRMSSVTNDFPCQRNVLFEREGTMFTSLRHMGAWGIGELQVLNQTLFTRGIFLDNSTGRVVTDNELGNIWKKVRAVSLKDESTDGATKAESEMQKFAREKVYFEVAMTSLKENPKIVDIFLQSPEYARFAMEFRDKYLSSLGLTERETAENMLANFYLFMFEGGDLGNSDSQVYLARINGFHDDLRTFVSSHTDLAPPLPEVKNPETDQEGALTALFLSLKKREYSFTGRRLKDNKKNAIIADAERSLEGVRNQIRRNVVDSALLSKLEATSMIVMKRGTFATLIGNFGLARVPGERRFTAQSWFPSADGYLPEGKPLPKISAREQVPTESEITQVIRDIFDAKTNLGQTAYESQEQRILGNAPLILAFLQKWGDMPENVRGFAGTLTSVDLAARLLERFGPITDNDPLIVNRFFPDGFSSFQISASYRYISDFVRGVETNIVLRTAKTPAEKLARKFTGTWKNNDFSGVSDEVLREAVRNTLGDASHRIQVLNHEAGVKRVNLKDYQEYFEKVFGWNTFDIWFLRWEKFWDVWNTLGGTWDCICFSRKSIFNPRVFQAW